MSETLPQGSQPNEGEQSDGENVSDSIPLDVLNETLGKDFKDVDTAIKSIKDTQSFVGKKIEKAEPNVDPDVNTRLDNLQSQLEDSNFYRANPQFDNEESRKLIAEFGGKPEEVVERDTFKNVFEKLSAYEETQNAKSVLHNSSRLGEASTKMDDAADLKAKSDDAASKGNMNEAMRAHEAAESKSVEAVIDSFMK